VVLSEDGGELVTFETLSGSLSVRRIGDGYELDLPVIPPSSLVEPPAALPEVLGLAPVEILGVRQLHHAAYWLAVYATEADVAGLQPDTRRMARELRANVICTAPGDEVDFVSRFFAPTSGVDEDPVTGSAHATLAPFWMERLQKNPLRARQVSRRGGSLTCLVERDRVLLRGSCATYLRGTVTLPH